MTLITMIDLVTGETPPNRPVPEDSPRMYSRS